MATPITRPLALTGTKRTNLRFDPATWQAIDLLAERVGCTWQDWCRAAISSAGPDTPNLTADIRQAVVAGLLGEVSIAEQRADQSGLLYAHPLLKDSGILDDKQLNAMLRKASVSGRADFGGFEVIVGFDEHGQDCVWIQNGLRDHPHFAFVVPENRADVSGGVK